MGTTLLANNWRVCVIIVMSSEWQYKYFIIALCTLFTPFRQRNQSSSRLSCSMDVWSMLTNFQPKCSLLLGIELGLLVYKTSVPTVLKAACSVYKTIFHIRVSIDHLRPNWKTWRLEFFKHTSAESLVTLCWFFCIWFLNANNTCDITYFLLYLDFFF